MAKTESKPKEKKKAELSPYQVLHNVELLQQQIKIKISKAQTMLKECEALEESLKNMVRPIENTPEYKAWLQIQEQKKAGSKS